MAPGTIELIIAGALLLAAAAAALGARWARAQLLADPPDQRRQRGSPKGAKGISDPILHDVSRAELEATNDRITTLRTAWDGMLEELHQRDEAAKGRLKRARSSEQNAEKLLAQRDGELPPGAIAEDAAGSPAAPSSDRKARRDAWKARRGL